jgi:hypothetical protein
MHKFCFAAGLILSATSAAWAGQVLGPDEAYDPEVNPADFTTTITNPYSSMPIGRKFVYEQQTEDGLERIEKFIPGWTKTIMGVETLVSWHREYLDGELIEDVRDYYAQHKNGDVWYFGEHIDVFEDGKLADHHGAWIAGDDGAKPGIWMLFDPQPGDEFRVEFYKTEAEDIRRVDALHEKAEVPTGKYTDCVKTYDWAPHDPGIGDSYFCREIGARALEVSLVSSDTLVEQHLKLIELDENGARDMSNVPAAYAGEGVVTGRAKAQ